MLLHQFMEYFGRETPDNPCLEMEAASFNYAQANARCNQMAHAFIDRGMAKGDRLAWIGKNSIELAFLFFAGSKVGVVPNPLNYRLAPPEWAYIINNSTARVLVCEAEFCSGIDKIRETLENIEHFVCLDGDPEGWSTFSEWVDTQPVQNPEHDIRPEDELYQMYTSGTTGLPKGAVLTQYAIETNTRAISLQFNMRTSEVRMVMPLPMYHAAAGVTIKCCISSGGSLIVHRDFNPVAVVDALENHGVTNVTLVPAMIQACLIAVPDIEQRDFSNLSTIAYGASPIAEETLRRAMAVFGCKFLQLFGMTETTACATQLCHQAHERALNGEPHLLLSCGRAAAGTRVRIVDEDHNEVPRGEVGEIAVKGPQLMREYWNMPEATAKTLVDGWLYTGDAAKMDEEGFIYIQDRIKDMIVSGGENIYPKEVENVLFDHPGVADAAVIGIPDEKYGEAILAFVQSRDGKDIEIEELTAFCRQRLAGFKVPRQFEFIDEVPRNASGKVLKKDLREPYWKDIERRVG
jgi:acyl-CoA synthetase (AMP-forming)/AMP-acid ligase II